MKLLRLGLRVLGLALTIALVNPGTAETQSRQSPRPPPDVVPERHIASIPGISSKRPEQRRIVEKPVRRPESESRD